MLLCNAAAVLVAVFPPRLLPRAMGVYLAGFSIAQVAGPAVGGLVTTWLGWRWTFLSCVPLCLLALGWGWRALGRVSLPRSSTVRVDVLGNLVIMIVMVGVLTAVTLAPSRGWSDLAVLAPSGSACCWCRSSSPSSSAAPIPRSTRGCSGTASSPGACSRPSSSPPLA